MSSTSNSPTTPNSATGQVPLHQKLKRTEKNTTGVKVNTRKTNAAKAVPRKTNNTAIPPQTLGQNIEQQILKAVSGNFDEKTVRTKLLKIALSCEGAIGACFLSKDLNDQWFPSISHPTIGKIPDRKKFADSLSEKCEDFSKSNNIKIEKLPSVKNCPGLFTPVRPRNAKPEIILIVLQSQAHALATMTAAQKLAASMQMWLNGRNAVDADWQVHALGAIIELIGKIENKPTVKSAAEEAANLLANRIGCNSVAIGLNRGHKLRIEAISGVSKIDKGSDLSQNYLQALVESVTRKQPGVHPALNADNNFLLQAHKQLAGYAQCEAVYSQPLVTADDTVFGAVVMTGTRSILQSSQVARFMGTAALPMTNAFKVVEKVKHSVIARTQTYLKSKISVAKRVLAIASAVGFCWLMFLPITYRVRCNCVTEPVSRRFAVAPFDGQIIVGHSEAGDLVKAGQVLAEMDGRTIRWELSGVTAEREQSLRTREVKLYERNVPEAILSELEYKRLVSEEEILLYKKEHLQIKSPIDGVVLSGSLERAEAASIETGQVLFEIGPVKPMRVEIAIPSNEIAQIQTGFGAKVWIDGQEDDPIQAEITKIHPRSETRDAKNVFIAEIEFPNDDERLRPGMKGSVRIDCEKRTLGWSLFHKPMNYVRSRLTWW